MASTFFLGAFTLSFSKNETIASILLTLLGHTSEFIDCTS